MDEHMYECRPFKNTFIGVIIILLAEQPYIKIEREVSSTEQKDVEHERMIFMYHDKIITKNREFHMSEVLDISYRKNNKPGNMGLLYIHTTSGLFSYTVKNSPNFFVETFNRYKN